MNIITIAGHLGADPEVRFTSSGQKVTTLRVASRARRNASGEEQTIWWRVTIWGEQFDKMMAYFKKGSAAMVVGELQKPEIFTGRDGQPQISLSITASNIMFSPFGRSAENKDRGGYASESTTASTENAADSSDAGIVAGTAPQVESFSDDEIPF